MAFIVRPVTAADRDWITQLLRERWGATLVVSRGQVHDAAALPGVVAATQRDWLAWRPTGSLAMNVNWPRSTA
ncbi:MAG TPA: hypothetical protein VFU78_09280 [Thermomicrobiales bacterium]|nr:hypothetical protein [Thermomicrobiales bacterium]